METDTLDRMDALEAKLDRIADQVAAIAAESAHQRRRRESMEELVGDVTPLLASGMESVGAELEQADIDLGDLKRLALRMAASADRLDAMLMQLDSLSELAADVAPFAGTAMASATTKLAELDDKGYFAFAVQAGGILDEIVTNYTEEDVANLGENVVLILDTVKQMTQPEVMGLLSQTAGAIHDEAEAALMAPEDPPSLFALMGQMRDPEVRMGLQRALSMLRSISGSSPVEPSRTNQGDE